METVEERRAALDPSSILHCVLGAAGGSSEWYDWVEASQWNAYVVMILPDGPSPVKTRRTAVVGSCTGMLKAESRVDCRREGSQVERGPSHHMRRPLNRPLVDRNNKSSVSCKYILSGGSMPRNPPALVSRGKRGCSGQKDFLLT